MERVPDQIGEVVGFRAWYVKTSRLRPPVLTSLMNQVPWPHDDWMRATCDKFGDDGSIPHPEPCSCGIYAARDRRELSRQWRYNRFDGVVIGECGLAGRIIPGTKAFRAEKARVLRLWLPFPAWELAAPLEERYGVPVELTNVLEEQETERRF
jgi:hypothetical protein